MLHFQKMSLSMVSLLYISVCFFLFPFIGEKKEKADISTWHPFHIAVTEVNHNISEKSLEISCKFFADDFEQTIERSYKTSLDITAGKDKALFDKYIPDYVNRHLMISIDGKPVILNYMGYQKEKESAYCFFSVINIVSIKNLDIANSLLHDFANDQINIVHVIKNGKRQSTTLNYQVTKASFRF
jgi:hypothetical protein